MRYDTPIYFQEITKGEYDPTTGDYLSDEVKETKVYADVTDAGVDTLNLIYGELRQGAKVIRLQRKYEGSYERIRIGRKTYRVDFGRSLRTKQNLVVSEVQE